MWAEFRNGIRTACGAMAAVSDLYQSAALLSPGPGVFGPAPTELTLDADKEALEDIQPLVDSMSTNLTTFSSHGGKLIFYHGDSDPWFSPLDTFGYYKDIAAANGGPPKVSKWSQFYFVPGMSHCAGGQALDQFDFLSALVQLGGERNCPPSVIPTGKAFPGRSRPLCAYPKHAHYKGQGDTHDANNFECR
jgi:Tannase and feruloyl esterase